MPENVYCEERKDNVTEFAFANRSQDIHCIAFTAGLCFIGPMLLATEQIHCHGCDKAPRVCPNVKNKVKLIIKQLLVPVGPRIHLYCTFFFSHWNASNRFFVII